VPSKPPPSPEEVRTWVQNLGSPEFEVREHAAENLADAGTPVLAALTEAVKSADPEVAHRAWGIIGDWAAEGNVAALLYQLSDDSPTTRAAAADGLGRQESHAQGALTALAVATRDADGSVRNAAKEAIKKIQATLSLRLDVTPVVEPTEVGTLGVYRVELSNQGNESYTNVSVRTKLPNMLELVHVEGNGQTQTIHGRVVTEPQTLEPGHSIRWDIQVKPLQPGESHVKVELQADGLNTPIKCEETAVIAPPRPAPVGP
jgi:hypothetical protein